MIVVAFCERRASTPVQWERALVFVFYFSTTTLMCSQTSAHEALADLLMRFIGELGTTSHSYAELACRTSTNLSDVVGS